MPIDRETQVVDCRESMGLDKGGGLAQRGTLSETGRPDVVAIAMTPGRRHITKPVCEITHGLRKEGIQVSVLVLYSGGGVPSDAKDAAIGHGPKFGLYREGDRADSPPQAGADTSGQREISRDIQGEGHPQVRGHPRNRRLSDPRRLRGLCQDRRQDPRGPIRLRTRSKRQAP